MSGRAFLSGRGLLSGVLIVLLGGSSLVFANDGALRQSGAPSAKLFVKPYSKLFQSPAIEQTVRVQQRVESAADSTKPRVVCGMTLIPAPNVDPKMVIQPRTDTTRYTIRAIEPPICGSADQK